MMRDFTINMYKNFCEILLKEGYTFATLTEYCREANLQRFVLMRHDVDKQEEHAMIMAKLEHSMGIISSYYFRCFGNSFNAKIIRTIHSLNHEIGYHYETLSKTNGDYGEAIKLFHKELTKLRELVPVTTICAHGAPLSKWDSKKLWERYNIADYGLIAESLLSFDFNDIYYLTDTGRRWNGEKVSVRDKVESKFNFNLRTTSSIIQEINKGTLPDRLMITIHPHRWNNKFPPWLYELIWQNIKNVGKRYFLVKK